MQDWRVFRPAIWLAMLGVALILVVRPAYFGAAVLGAAIGIALRIERGRRRAAGAAPPRGRRR
jgi:hypothetical protein